jgi:cell division protein FtsB
MSDGKDVAGAGAPVRDAASAEARLRDAVAGAKAAVGKAPRLRPRIAAALLGGLCLGSFAGGAAVALLTKGTHAERPAISQAEWKRLAAKIDAQSAESARLAADVKLLKDGSGEAHAAAEKARAESGTRFGQLSERLDRLQKLGTESGAKLAAVTDKLDHMDRDQGTRFAALADKVEKTEKTRSVVPVAAASPKAAEPVVTGALPDKPASKPTPATLEEWTLRDVYDGVAMLENRNRRLVEVGPGDTLPGGGRVEGIERRGKVWVVVTNRGLITPQAW